MRKDKHGSNWSLNWKMYVKSGNEQNKKYYINGMNS